MLLDAGADRNSALEERATGLHHAAQEAHVERVRLLLDASAYSKCETVGEVSLLHYAAREGYLEIARLLLDACAEENGQIYIASPL